MILRSDNLRKVGSQDNLTGQKFGQTPADAIHSPPPASTPTFTFRNRAGEAPCPVWATC